MIMQKKMQLYWHYIYPAANVCLIIPFFVLTLASCDQQALRTNNYQQHSKTGTGARISTDSLTGMNATYWNTLPTNQIVISRQKVITPVFNDTTFTITGNGIISFDIRRNKKIPVRVGGRIERLYIKYNYQYVHKGEKILEIYSPELNTYVSEYLYLIRKTNDTVLQKKAKQKLSLLGLTQTQIQQIDRAGNTSPTVALYSPFEGYVLFSPSISLPMDNTNYVDVSMGSGMSGENNSTFREAALPDNSIREGMYINRDQTLFWVNDFKEVWGIVSLTKGNDIHIYQGKSITVYSELLPDKPIETSIQVIEKIYAKGQKFTQARVYIPNPSGILKQNSLITAIAYVPVNSLMIPASSVYFLGKKAIVWVQIGTTTEGNPVFQSRTVTIGHRNGDQVEILKGITQNEKIAQDAGYLTDSETIIQY